MTERYLSPVSEAYTPAAPHQLSDDPLTPKYRDWGYSIGYESDEHGNAVPEGGNTAVFRIAPQGLTEPVYVTKMETDATFTVNVLNGEGIFIRAQQNGQVDEIPMTKGSIVVVHPGDAYSYKNTGTTDLLLHDVALPAYEEGDDAELLQAVKVQHRTAVKDGLGISTITTREGASKTIELPKEFFEAVGNAMRTA